MKSDVWRLEDATGRAFELPEHGKVVVGSSAERATIVIDAPGVDDAHCAIGRARDGSFAVKDLGSAAGTFIDGRRTQAGRLENGTRLTLGSQDLWVLAPGEVRAPGETAGSAARQRDPSLPRRIGGFRIEERLGRGGMGEVFLAVQESLHRPVALKVLSPEFAADVAFVHRFQSEARAAAALSHPNVVVVFDVGEADGHHFLAMEYMSGGNLEERIEREGRLPWRDVVAILRDAASGLAFAEERGILHRDIKPANLMVSASGVVKIADLGLATQVEQQSADGKTFGTPHFISPEQARGEAVDCRSDLYSLGATAYRLLTGRTPFQGRSAREIVRARFTEDPIPPADLVPGVPEPLSELLLSLLARDPDDRPASALALLDELSELPLDGQPERPRRALPIATLLLVVFALGGGAWWFLGRGRTRASEPRAAELGSPPAATTGSDPTDDASFFGDASAGPTNDEEAALRRREREARGAFEAIPSGYSTEDRIDALAEFVDRFPGTDTAAQAARELDELRAERTSADRASERRALEIERTLDRIVEASGWTGADASPEGPVPLGPAVERIRAYQAGTALMTDPDFLAGRARRIEAIVAETLEFAHALAEDAERRIAAGDFDGALGPLERLAHGFELGEPALSDPRAFEELRALSAAAAERIANLDAEREAWRTELVLADRLDLAAALGSASPFPAELGALRPGATAKRLLGLAPARSDTERTRRAHILSRLQSARAALDLLPATFSAGLWRRRTVAVPGPRRASSREVVGVRDDGLLLGAEGNAEFLPFGRFASDPETLAALFRNRFSRQLTPAEAASVTRLLTLAGVARVLATTVPFLASADGGLFGPKDRESIEESFAPARKWALRHDPEDTEQRSALAELAEEEAAARILAEALRAAAEESWTQAAADLEDLLRGHGDAWIVLALSDGTAIPEDAVTRAHDASPAGASNDH
ncbi:MAG TPA: FHA domain-containing protein [Planctomycetes bacterium]|nr:FHA domain-containing protein [Planctomycetota bacterium]